MWAARVMNLPLGFFSLRRRPLVCGIGRNILDALHEILPSLGYVLDSVIMVWVIGHDSHYRPVMRQRLAIVVAE